MPIRSANWIISAIPDPNTGVTHHDSRHAFLQALTEVGKIAVATHRIEDNEELRNSGAHLILHRYYDAADRAVELLHSEEGGCLGGLRDRGAAGVLTSKC